MIDWWRVFTNSLWILGLSTLLAAFSYNDWLATETGQRRRDLFKEPAWRLPCSLGLFLTCAGWMLSQADRWWEKVLWFGLAAWFGWEMLLVMMALYQRSGAGRKASGNSI